MFGVPSKHKSGYQKRKEKEGRLQSERKGLQTLFQVGVHANGCDNSSAASAVYAVESNPEVGSTSDDDSQLSASLSFETTNPRSLQDDFQTSELKAKQLKSTESTQPNSIPKYTPTQGLLSVAELTSECETGLW